MCWFALDNVVVACARMYVDTKVQYASQLYAPRPFWVMTSAPHNITCLICNQIVLPSLCRSYLHKSHSKHPYIYILIGISIILSVGSLGRERVDYLLQNMCVLLRVGMHAYIGLQICLQLKTKLTGIVG